jgi:hypothetical protein
MTGRHERTVVPQTLQTSDKVIDDLQQPLKQKPPTKLTSYFRPNVHHLLQHRQELLLGTLRLSNCQIISK